MMRRFWVLWILFLLLAGMPAHAQTSVPMTNLAVTTPRVAVRVSSGWRPSLGSRLRRDAQAADGSGLRSL